jgi:hypothetical protein
MWSSVHCYSQLKRVHASLQARTLIHPSTKDMYYVLLSAEQTNVWQTSKSNVIL